jgi:hypothetical protein
MSGSRPRDFNSVGLLYQRKLFSREQEKTDIFLVKTGKIIHDFPVKSQEIVRKWFGGLLKTPNSALRGQTKMLIYVK